MPFRASFACLWCGADHVTRSPDDLEGWAQLCPTCLGKAGDNNFLRVRLRQALIERGAAAVPAPAPAPDHEDDWYLRRGTASEGPIHDAAFLAELDAAGRWLDALPLSGRIVHLQAGTGWWAPLLAGKGELSLFDTSSAALDLARERLLAHGLRAHLHVRDAWLPPDAPADVLLLERWLGRLDEARVPAALAHARGWLRPGGRLAIIEAQRAPGIAPGSAAGFAAAGDLGRALASAGFEAVEAGSTGRFLLVASAVAPV